MYRLFVILSLTFFVGYVRPDAVKVGRTAAASFFADWIDRETCNSEDWPLSTQELTPDRTLNFPKQPDDHLSPSASSSDRSTPGSIDTYDELVGLPNFVLFQKFNIIEAIPADQSDAFCINLLSSSGEHLCPNIRDEYHSTEAVDREVLRMWLLGRGKQPVSWSTLIKVLYDTKLITTAEALISKLSKLKVPDDIDANLNTETVGQDCLSTDSDLELHSTKISDPPDILLLQKLNVFSEIRNQDESATVCTYLLRDESGNLWYEIKNNADDVEDRNRAVFERWLRKPVTWSILIDALNKSQLRKLSKKIKQSVGQCALHIPSHQYSYSQFISSAESIKESYKTQHIIKFSRVQTSLPNKRKILPLSLKDHHGAPLDLKKILESDVHQQRWVITGQPGSGKTSLMRYIAKEWSEGKALISCQFLFLIHLRECEGKYHSLSELLHVSYIDYDGIEQIATEIQSTNGNATCLLLDGYDEKNEKRDIVYEMLYNNKLPYSTRILTSRSGYIENYHSEINHAEIVGFDMEHLDSYLYNLTDNNSMIINKVHSIWKDQNVKEMCQLPLHMVMVIYIAAETKDISIQTKTDLYRSFLFATTDHFEPIDDDRDWNTSTLRWCIMGEEEQYYDQQLCRSFKKLLEIAHDMLKNKKTSFLSSSSLKRDINTLGFTDMIDINVNFAREVHYVFAHRTFQEFFAALHLVTLPQEQQLVQVIKEEHHNDIDQVMSNVFSVFHPFLHFYFGLLGYFYEGNPLAISLPFKTIVAQRTYHYTCPNGQQFMQSLSVLDLHREIGLKGKKNARLLQSAGVVVNHSVCFDISQMSSYSSMGYLVNYSAIHQIHVCDRQRIRHNYVTAVTIENWNNPLNRSHLALLECVMTFNTSDKRDRKCYELRNESILTSVAFITSKSSVDMTEKKSQTLASQVTNLLTSSDNTIHRLLGSEMGLLDVNSKTVGLCEIGKNIFSTTCEENQQDSNCELLSLISILCQPRNMLKKELLFDARDKLQKFHQESNQNHNPISGMLDQMISITQRADDSNKLYAKNSELESDVSSLLKMVDETFMAPLNIMNQMSGLNLADKGEGFADVLQNLATCLSNLTSFKLEITRSQCDEVVSSPKIISMLSTLAITRVSVECCETYLNTMLGAFPSAIDLALHLVPCHHGVTNDPMLAIKLPNLRSLFVKHPSRNTIELISELRQLQSVGINDYAFNQPLDMNLLHKIVSQNKELHTLQISESEVDVNALVEILLTGTNIQQLQLEMDGLNDNDVATLGRAFIKMNHLTTLSLRHNYISGKGVPILVRVLDGTVNLHSLNLADNYQLTENWDGVKELSKLTNLRALYITGCKLDQTHLSILTKTLPELKYLESLEIGDFQMLDEDEEDLVKLYEAIYRLNFKHLKIVELIYRVN